MHISTYKAGEKEDYIPTLTIFILHIITLFIRDILVHVLCNPILDRMELAASRSSDPRCWYVGPDSDSDSGPAPTNLRLFQLSCTVPSSPSSTHENVHESWLPTGLYGHLHQKRWNIRIFARQEQMTRANEDFIENISNQNMCSSSQADIFPRT